MRYREVLCMLRSVLALAGAVAVCPTIKPHIRSKSMQGIVVRGRSAP